MAIWNPFPLQQEEQSYVACSLWREVPKRDLFQTKTWHRLLAKHCTRNRFRVLRCPRYGVQCDFSEIAPACAQLFSFVFWQRGESCVQAGAAFRKVTLKFVPRATQDAKLLPPRWVWSQRWGGEAMDLKSTLPFMSCVSRKFPKTDLLLN